MSAMFLGLLFAVTVQVTGQEQGIANPSQLEEKVMARAARELPAIERLFPQNPDQPITVGRTQRSIGFFYAQPEARDKMRFEKVRYNIGHIRIGEEQIGPGAVRVRNRRVRKEQKEGTIDFNIAATVLSVAIDAKPSSALWRGDSVEELATAYNREKEEDRRRAEEARQRGMGTSQVFASSRPPLRQEGEPPVTWDDYKTTVESHLYAQAFQREYLGVPGEVIAYRDKGVRSGYPAEYYGEFIYNIARGDLPKEIEARARYKLGDDEVLVRVHTKAWHLGWPDRVVSLAQVDTIMRVLIRILLEELGQPVPETVPPPPEPDIPQPDVPEPRQVQPDDPQTSDRIAGGIEREPERPKTPAAERIAAMDDIFRGIEDELTGRLLNIELLTREMKRLRADMLRWREAKKDYNDEKTKAKASERMRKLVNDLKHVVQRRNKLIAELRQLMNDTVTQVEQAYNSYGFGELDFSAALRVEAARARRGILFAQIELAKGDGPGARRAAEQMRSIPSMQGASYYFEAMGFAAEGRAVEALETIRSARRMGYTQGVGVQFEEYEAKLEIAVLRAIQAAALNESARLQSDNEAWIGSKARTNALPGESNWDSFAIMVVEYGYYDAVTGSLRGGAEADVREQKLAIELDDLSSTHVGLGILSSLRENHTLAEIRDMDAEAFKKAVSERWDRQLTDKQVRQYRGLVRHVMQMPDVKKLASGEILTEHDVLSEPVMQRLKSSFEAPVHSIWFRPAQIGADVGNMLTGRQMFFTFAGGAVLTRVGGLPMGSEAARQALAGAPTVSKFFAMSRPAQKATELLMRDPRTAAAMQGMAKIHEWGQQSFRNTAAVMFGQIGVGFGTSYAVQKYVGDEAVLLLDVLGAMGVDSPEFYHHALNTLRNAGIQTAKQAARAAAQMTHQAQQVQRVLNQTDQVAQQISRMVDTSTGEDAWQALGREIGAMEDVPEQMRRGLLEVAEHGRRGRQNVARQMLADYHKTSDDLLRRVDAHLRGAEQVRDLAVRLPESVPNPSANVARQSERMKRIALQGPPERLALPPADIEGRQLLPAGRGDAPNLQSDVDVPSIGDDLDNALSGRGAADGPAGGRASDMPATGGASDLPATGGGATVGSGSSQTGPVGTPQHAPLRINEPDSPLHVGDRLLADDQFNKALIEYEKLLDDLPANSPLAREIRYKMKVACEAQEMLDSRHVLQDALGDVTPPAQVLAGDLPTPVAQAALTRVPPQALIADAIGGNPAPLQKWINDARAAGQPHLVPIFHAKGGKPTYSTPYFIVDGAGNTVGVAKSALGRWDHPEGILEDFASRLGESLNRNIPRARRHGTWTVMELLPQGKTLSELNPGGSRLLSHREELLDDMIFSMFLGDGDRHFGNLMVRIDGKLVPIDFGLADLLPQHPYRRPDMIKTMDDWAAQAQQRVDDLLASPVPTDPDALARRAEAINKFREQVRAARRNRGVFSTYAPDDINLRPDPDSPEFEQFVRETMEKQLKHGTRTWDSGDRMLSSAMTPEGLSKRIDDFTEKIKQLRGGGDDQLKKMLDASFGAEHPQREYAEKLLETRLKVMKEIFLEHFGALQPVSLNDADTTVRPCLSLLRAMSTFAMRPAAVFVERRLAA